jgi:hypothetical protein
VLTDARLGGGGEGSVSLWCRADVDVGGSRADDRPTTSDLRPTARGTRTHPAEAAFRDFGP